MHVHPKTPSTQPTGSEVPKTVQNMLETWTVRVMANEQLIKNHFFKAYEVAPLSYKTIFANPRTASCRTYTYESPHCPLIPPTCGEGAPPKGEANGSLVQWLFTTCLLRTVLLLMQFPESPKIVAENNRGSRGFLKMGMSQRMVSLLSTGTLLP